MAEPLVPRLFIFMLLPSFCFVVVFFLPLFSLVRFGQVCVLAGDFYPLSLSLQLLYKNSFQILDETNVGFRAEAVMI